MPSKEGVQPLALPLLGRKAEGMGRARRARNPWHRPCLAVRARAWAGQGGRATLTLPLLGRKA